MSIPRLVIPITISQSWKKNTLDASLIQSIEIFQNTMESSRATKNASKRLLKIISSSHHYKLEDIALVETHMENMASQQLTKSAIQNVDLERLVEVTWGTVCSALKRLSITKIWVTSLNGVKSTSVASKIQRKETSKDTSKKLLEATGNVSLLQLKWTLSLPLFKQQDTALVVTQLVLTDKYQITNATCHARMMKEESVELDGETQYSMLKNLERLIHLLSENHMQVATRMQMIEIYHNTSQKHMEITINASMLQQLDISSMLLFKLPVIASLETQLVNTVKLETRNATCHAKVTQLKSVEQDGGTVFSS